MRQSVVSRLAVLAGALALFAGPVACGSILGIGDPTVVEDSGTGAGEGGLMDHTSSGGQADVTVDTKVDTGSEAGDGTATTDGDAGAEDASEDSDAVAADSAGDVVVGDGGCLSGYVTCAPEGGAPGTGPCVNLSSDIKNCSNCGTACPVNNNTPVCHLGSCQLGACNTNFFDCNNNPTDGCEINLQTDPLNCGSCGMICPSGQLCVNGACGTKCTSTSQSICEQLPDGGAAPFVEGGAYPLYCADLGSDTTNCGACGTKCPVNNNTPVCSSGTCTTGPCATGYADCNNDPADGCEVNLNADPTHCGTCGNDCTAASATTECLSGQCAIASCATGTADCDHLYSTGCETNTTNDTLNCGACGNSCATTCTGNVGSVACSGSSCKVTTCGPGYLDIDGLCADGCECAQTTVGTCAAPRTVALTGPGSSTNVTGNLVPSGESDWFTVTFGNNKATNYHPHVVFMTNPGAEYVFDVETNCSGGNLACGVEKLDGGAAAHSTGLTEWEVFYNAGVDFVDASFNPIPSVGTIFVHVYRASGVPVDCKSYTLTISD